MSIAMVIKAMMVEYVAEDQVKNIMMPQIAVNEVATLAER